jgi:hypothetical protein
MHSPFRHSMNVLMAEQVNQRQVAVAILTPLRFCQTVVNLKFFLIEE